MVLGLIAARLLLTEFSTAKMWDFHLRGADGRRYSLKSLTAGKPVLLFFVRPTYRAVRTNPDGTYNDKDMRVSGLQKPNPTADLNRLSRMAKGKLRVAAFTYVSHADVRTLARQIGAKFLLLGDDAQYSSMEVINQILTGYHSRDLHHLQSVLILPNGEYEVWPGYSRASLGQVQRIIARKTGVRLGLDLSKFRRRRQAGEAEMYGLPH